MNRIIISAFILMNIVSGITPPQNGNFPNGFWEKMRQQGIGQNYGDPGWIRKIAGQNDLTNRDAQFEFFLPVLLGKYSDASSTYFNSTNFDDLLFGNNPTGSMSDYFNEISYENFHISRSKSSDIFEFLLVSNKRNHKNSVLITI